MSVHNASMDDAAGARARSRPIRVALVDDHQFIADMLSRALERQAGKFEFLGNAPRLADVGALLRQEPADVVLVDYSLPDGRGSDVLRMVRRQWPRARMVLFTGHSESDILHEAIAAGADGVLTKDMGMDHILDVIERAHRGDVLLDAGTLRDLMTQPAAGASRLAALDRLTPRERIVLESILAAGTTAEAARRIHMAPATLRVHLHRASQKLGATSRLEAISMALRAGLIRAPSGSPRVEATMGGAGSKA
jgi:two-component system, NarL family, nitrate/nitrite response regulator NarL